MCGLAGIYSHKPVATELYDSLIHLQHRGQDAAGITTYNKHMHKTKGVGLVRDIFTEKKIKRLKGNIGICLLYTSPSPRDGLLSRMPSSA